MWDYRNGALTQRWSYDPSILGEHAPHGHQFRLGDPDNPLLVAAFEGWNDAGDAATGAIEISELSRQFNAMADRLEESVAIIRRDRDRLAAHGFFAVLDDDLVDALFHRHSRAAEGDRATGLCLHGQRSGFEHMRQADLTWATIRALVAMKPSTTMRRFCAAASSMAPHIWATSKPPNGD